MHHVAVNNIELCQDLDLRDSQIRRFWSLEAMGITGIDTTPHPIKDTTTLSSSSDSFRIEDGRAVVLLPKKEHFIEADRLIRKGASSPSRKGDTNPDFRTMYENKMLDYILQHLVEVAPPGPTAAPKFYLPQHAVKKNARPLNGESFLTIVLMSQDPRH